MSMPLLRRRVDSDFHSVSELVLFTILAPWVLCRVGLVDHLHVDAAAAVAALMLTHSARES